jgi:ATP/maltotriose-dependent transcriptional regulator MalT
MYAGLKKMVKINSLAAAEKRSLQRDVTESKKDGIKSGFSCRNNVIKRKHVYFKHQFTLSQRERRILGI